MNQHGNATTIYTLPKSFGAKVNIQEPRPVIKREREKVIASRTDESQPTGKLILQARRRRRLGLFRAARQAFIFLYRVGREQQFRQTNAEFSHRDAGRDPKLYGLP